MLMTKRISGRFCAEGDAVEEGKPMSWFNSFKMVISMILT